MCSSEWNLETLVIPQNHTRIYIVYITLQQNQVLELYWLLYGYGLGSWVGCTTVVFGGIDGPVVFLGFGGSFLKIALR